MILLAIIPAALMWIIAFHRGSGAMYAIAAVTFAQALAFLLMGLDPWAIGGTVTMAIIFVAVWIIQSFSETA